MKKIVLAVAAIIGTVVLPSCNDYLDKIPDNRTELNSKDKISEILVNAYPKASYMLFTETMSDNVGDKGSDAYTTELSNTEPFFWKDCTTEGADTPAYYWDACYQAIAHANMALEVISKSSQKEEMSEQRGEALLCRAYAHFMLVTLFSKTYDKATAESDLGVPYVTEVEKVVSKEYNRGTVASVYQSIENDLREGLLLITGDSYKIPKYHFNKRAAYAFASRFYLFKKEYGKVVEYSDLALGSEPTTLFRDWKSYTKLQYKELKQLYTMSSESSNLLLQENLSQWGQIGNYYRYAFTFDKMKSLFINKNVTGGDWISAYSIVGDQLSVHLPKFEVFFKKVGVGASTGWPYIMAPLFTIEETFFNRLEAKLLSGTYTNEDIVAELNLFASLRIKDYRTESKNNVISNVLSVERICDYYKQNCTKESLLECILEFKRVEYLHEGLRWFDILRHNKEVVHRTFEGEEITLKANDPRRVIQIPIRAINCGIPKNPR